MDLQEYCRCPKLKLQQLRDGRLCKPKASYILSFTQGQNMCKWVQELKMPNNYASNLGWCVNVAQGRFFRLKSHDCHVFMECLLPIAFRELYDHEYFKELCLSTLRVDDHLVMEKNIPTILCKLERISPHGFFHSMEHLLIHLAYKAWVLTWFNIDGCIRLKGR